MDYLITIDLGRFFGARIVQEEDPATNLMEDGIFIPFGQNGLETWRGRGPKAAFIATECQIYNKKGTHAIGLCLKKEKREERERNGFDNKTFLGTMKPWFKKKK